MDLDHANFQPQNLFDIGTDVTRLTGMNSAAGDQALRVSLHVVGDELIHF